MLARTPLYDRHVAAGARMVEFAGYSMPLQYTSIREEHVAVRTRAGLFDLSHMGEVRIGGAGALPAVQSLLTNDASRAAVGAAMYSVMCNEQGGIIDDVVAYHDAGDWLVVVNAACRAKDVGWMREHAGGASVDDESDDIALLAVQGPRALQIVQRLVPTPIDGIAAFHFEHATVAGVPALLSRTGYTGEDGFELYVDAAAAGDLWDALLSVGREAEGMLQCGLGARDTLRLEAGLRLYGQDMDDSTDPYSCGLGWTVKLDKGDFIGAEALRRLNPKQPPHRFIGLRLPERAIARHGNDVSAGTVVGHVTSGTFSFTLGYGIATASVASDMPPDAQLSVNIRGTGVAAERVRLPFYRRSQGA
ncbi:MAG: glycine cleavage system aminomethyltransferase GcvT [Candidatus Dormibacteraeota bacterium]|nr:glycine cleavage system aminomethyltransferase GcvT [Candidatus Dormibacteraeota bacterium]